MVYYASEMMIAIIHVGPVRLLIWYFATEDDMAKEMQVTSRRTWRFGADVVRVEYSNTDKAFGWRLVVNGDASPWEMFYQGVTAWRGYGYVTQYYGDGSYTGHDCIPVDQPFKITRGEELV